VVGEKEGWYGPQGDTEAASSKTHSHSRKGGKPWQRDSSRNLNRAGDSEKKSEEPGHVGRTCGEGDLKKNVVRKRRVEPERDKRLKKAAPGIQAVEKRDVLSLQRTFWQTGPKEREMDH